jgi:hypothetical protein
MEGEMNSFDQNCSAVKVIDFIGSLFAMDEFGARRGHAAIDLRTGVIIRAHEDYPDGEMLQLEYAPGVNSEKTLVRTFKLVESLLVRHAEAQAITDGGKVRDHYDHISQHFRHKTGMFVD